MTHARCSTRNHQSHWPTPSIAGRSTGDPILADLHGLASKIGYWLSGALILACFSPSPLAPSGRRAGLSFCRPPTRTLPGRTTPATHAIHERGHRALLSAAAGGPAARILHGGDDEGVGRYTPWAMVPPLRGQCWPGARRRGLVSSGGEDDVDDSGRHHGAGRQRAAVLRRLRGRRWRPGWKWVPRASRSSRRRRPAGRRSAPSRAARGPFLVLSRPLVQFRVRGVRCQAEVVHPRQLGAQPGCALSRSCSCSALVVHHLGGPTRPSAVTMIQCCKGQALARLTPRRSSNSSPTATYPGGRHARTIAYTADLLGSVIEARDGQRQARTRCWAPRGQPTNFQPRVKPWSPPPCCPAMAQRRRGSPVLPTAGRRGSARAASALVRRPARWHRRGCGALGDRRAVVGRCGAVALRSTPAASWAPGGGLSCTCSRPRPALGSASTSSSVLARLRRGCCGRGERWCGTFAVDVVRLVATHGAVAVALMCGPSRRCQCSDGFARILRAMALSPPRPCHSDHRGHLLGLVDMTVKCIGQGLLEALQAQL